MKRFMLVIPFLAMCVFISAQSAMAAGVETWAKVNPNWEDNWNEDTLQGTALYTIAVKPKSSYGANFFDFRFEPDIFASIEAEFLPPSPPDPKWSLAYYDSYQLWPLDANYYESVESYSLVLNPGESISFLVNYTLRSADQYYRDSGYDEGLGLDWAWEYGSPWEQAVFATNTLHTGRTPTGFTTTHHTPEPATMVLLGTGLIGLAAFGRKKFRGGKTVK